MNGFIRSVCELIWQDEPFVMATVVESNGSTPRASGAKMAVRADGSIIGTVGGGLTEARVCKDGRAMLEAEEEDGTARLVTVDVTQESAADSNTICGDGLSVLLEMVEPNGPCAVAYDKLGNLLQRGRRVALSTRLEQRDSLHAVNHVILTGPMGNDTPVLEKDADGMSLVEPMIPPVPLYIFGAGHVSLFTARVGSMIGFRTVVLDDRADFANRERFPEVDEVVALPSFDGCCEGLDIDENAFVIVMTRSHLHDRNVLAEVLRTKARYVGMIGSRKKREKIYHSLLESGFSQQDIDRCHCPVGLTIGAQTPEEIAVSIAGELIGIRSGHTA